MVGLEAVLQRTDLPTPVEITEGFAAGKTWNYCFAIMGGLLARQRAGKGFSDLTPEVRTTGLLLCHNYQGMCVDDDLPALQEALEAIVIPTAKDRRGNCPALDRAVSCGRLFARSWSPHAGV